MADNLPTFGIIIPSRNETGYMEKALASVLANDYPREKMEVLVVDGMSTDGTREMVERLGRSDSRVRLIDNPRRFATAAFNLGIQASQADVLIILGGHSEVAPDFLKNYARVLEEHPDAWSAGGVIETVGRGYTGRAVAAAMKSVMGLGSRKYTADETQDRGYVPDAGGWAAVRRWVYDRVGLFDESFVRNADTDFTVRFVRAGGKSYVSSSVRSRYYCRASLWKLFRQQFQDGFWRIRNIQKVGRPAHARQLIPLLFVLGWIFLAAGAILWQPLVFGLAAYAGLYFGAGCFFAVKAGKQDGFDIVPVIPLVFLAMHLGYGLGELKGIWSWMILRGKFVPRPEEHGITR